MSEQRVSEHEEAPDGRETLTPQLRGEKGRQVLRSSKPHVREGVLRLSLPKRGHRASPAHPETPPSKALRPRDPPRPGSDARGRRPLCRTPARP